MFDHALITRTKTLLDHCNHMNELIVTAESCTGGLISSLITEIPGSSKAFDCGFVTYHNHAKTNLLGVPAEILDSDGAVSSKTASAMAKGAIVQSNGTVAIATTGIAGPDGGSNIKPIGLVYFAIARKNGDISVDHQHFQGNRTEIRLQAVRHAIEFLLSAL